ncbi:hypothetical protein F2Q70_00027103 [Brassica cretica]|uniref:Uncharacterized protein n=1 Tax=Brassica cretica TaxID=69181 RepID=A0A8S9LHW3_BRACR|nr:hypothetical protein F2Q70_00027103 [Brassica cretica]
MVSQRERIAVLEVERDRDIHRTSRIAHRDIAANYREVPEYLKDRWASKKKKVSAEIWLQEVTANIDLLTELKDGGLTVDAELARLKGMEGDCEDLVASAPVPDWSISELDLPQVSDDSVDQVGGSSVPDDYTQSSDRLTRQLVRRSSFRTSGSASRGRASRKSPLISIHDSDDEDVSGENRHPVSLSPGSEDETVAATRKRRRSWEGALPGPSHPRFVSKGDGSSFAAQSDLISLAGRMRSVGCRIPSLASSVEREAYAKVIEPFNEYVVMMEDHVVASRNDKEIESIGFEIKRLSKELQATKREGKKDAEKIEALTEDWRRVHLEKEALTFQMVSQRARIAAIEVERDRDIRRASRIACRNIAAKYPEVLESLKDRWASKKKEVSAEIRLQEVTANIDLLTKLKDGGLTVDAELA